MWMPAISKDIYPQENERSSEKLLEELLGKAIASLGLKTNPFLVLSRI